MATSEVHRDGATPRRAASAASAPASLTRRLHPQSEGAQELVGGHLGRRPPACRYGCRRGQEEGVGEETYRQRRRVSERVDAAGRRPCVCVPEARGAGVTYRRRVVHGDADGEAAARWQEERVACTARAAIPATSRGSLVLRPSMVLFAARRCAPSYPEKVKATPLPDAGAPQCRDAGARSGRTCRV